MSTIIAIDHIDHDLTTVLSRFIPQNLSWGYKLKDVGYCNYRLGLKQKTVDGSASINGDDVLTLGHDFIGPYRTHYHLLAIDDSDLTGIGQKLHAGFHTSLGGGWGKDYLDIGGKDWMHYFERRVFPFDARPAHVYDNVYGTPPTGLSAQFAASDGATSYPEAIAVAILNHVIAMTFTYSPPFTSYSNWGSDHGQAIDYSLSLGDTTSIKSIVDDLAALQSTSALQGFDYWIREDMNFFYNVPYAFGNAAALIANGQTLGSYNFNTNKVVLNLDTVTVPFPTDPWSDTQFTIKELTFTNNGPGGTHVKGFGAGLNNNLGVTIGYVAGEATYWRLDDTKQYGNITSPSMLADLTQAWLSYDLNPIHEITITIDGTDGNLDWVNVRPGMAIYLKLDLGWHQIDSPWQIVSTDFTLTPAGNVVCDLGLQQIYDTVSSTFTGNPEG